MKLPRRAIIAAVAAAGVVAGILHLGIAPPAPARVPTRLPAVTLTTIEGEQLTAADLRGKVVLVNFWATSCVACVKEMPKLVETYRRHRDRGFETIAVAMSYDPPNYVLHYAEKNALPFRVALDPMGAAARAFGDVSLTPTTFVVDRHGTIVKRVLGEPDFAELDRLIEGKLAEAG
jgi:peroxiredoxin